ncbi:MAG: type II toxin-antitoxin system HicA family toxin [Fidelibacterota bacterium]
MKRTILLKYLVKNHCILKRHGSKHDIYVNIITGKQTPIPRHSEISESLAKLIKKQLGVD